VCINHPETRGVQEGRGKRIAKKAGKSNPGNCMVALEGNKTQNVLFRFKLILIGKEMESNFSCLQEESVL